MFAVYSAKIWFCRTFTAITAQVTMTIRLKTKKERWEKKGIRIMKQKKESAYDA